MHLIAIEQPERGKYRYYDGRGPSFDYMTIDEWEALQAKEQRQKEAAEQPKQADIEFQWFLTGAAIFVAFVAVIALAKL